MAREVAECEGARKTGASSGEREQECCHRQPSHSDDYGQSLERGLTEGARASFVVSFVQRNDVLEWQYGRRIVIMKKQKKGTRVGV
mmetsp:Transcript_65753/g.137437  ORF Transcript_65753/g.137437 Transcript_65753/m.137437 type:complete len:86 (-) Transcript_65753:84-341(-)